MSSAERSGAPEPSRRDDIAIIGIGCRYPGAHGPLAFWELVRSGRCTVSPPPPERIALGYDLDRYLDPRPRVPGRISSPYAGFLEHPDRFDPTPFGLTPREVRSMEPQQRLMVEVTWDALLDAGIPPASLQGERVAVILGHMAEDYSRERIAVLGEDTVNRGLDVFTVAGMSRAVLSGRISWLLGVTGPSLTLDTACSSSLIATHLACQSLLTGESRWAIAGGVNLFLTPEGNIALSRSGMLAPDGRCKAFDASADGFVRAEGAGVVLLRPLADALAAGDPIYAVIRGTGISTDGRDGGHMMAPGRHGQAQAMHDAYARAGVSPADVDFVETHGTGTRIGDPVEIGALADVMGPGRPADRPLRVSSAKGSIGHSESASGVAGLIRAALALAHRELPAQLHFVEPTPHIPWAEIPVQVQTEHAPWPGEGPRLAGVNSFGISGTNAHVVLESPPDAAAAWHDGAPARATTTLSTAAAIPDGHDTVATPDRAILVPFSAHDAEALEAMLRQTLDALRSDAPPPLADLAYTLGRRRAHATHRFAAVATSPAELADEIQAALAGRASGASARGEAPAARGAHERVFVFPGQGAQTLGMGRQLLAGEPAFREALEALDAAYAHHADWSLLDAVHAPERAGTLERLSRLQPTLVAVEIAIARLWMDWGIVPDAVVGQSLGEIAAAHVAGCLDVDAVARLACHRGRMVERAAGRGAMALVGLPAADVEALLRRQPGRLEIAGSSSPTTTIVAGDRPAVEACVAGLAERDVFARKLEVDFASHCFHMDPLLDDFAAGLAGLAAAPGAIPFYSTVEPGPRAGETLDVDYWVRNLRAPVAFTAALERLLADGARELVEISPHPTLARAIPETAARAGVSVHAVPSLLRDRDERTAMRTSLAQLYARGAAVDFAREGAAGRVLRLPPYPYQRRRFWFGERTRADLARPTHALLGPRIAAGPDAADGAVWQTTLDLDAAPWLDDYRIDGRRTLPAALYVELAIGVARDRWPDGGIAIHDLRVWPPLVLDAAGRATLQLRLRPTGDGEAELWMSSREGDGMPWTPRAVCRVGPAAAERSDATDATELPDREAGGAAAEAFVRALGDDGLALGPRMATLRALATGPRGALARAALPRAAESESHTYFVHPALLEPCLALAAGSGRAATVTTIESIRFAGPAPPEVGCTVRTDASGGAAIDLLDAAGAAALSLRGVRTRPVGRGACRPAPDAVSLHAVEWQPLELDAQTEGVPPIAWTLCAEDDIGLGALAELATELGKRGGLCRRHAVERVLDGSADLDGPAGERGLVLLAELDRAGDETAARARLARLVDALLEDGPPPEHVWLITRDASQRAGARGGASGDDAQPDSGPAPRPHAGLDPALDASAAAATGDAAQARVTAPVWASVDTAPAATAWAALADAMITGIDEPRVALRAGGLVVPRLAEAASAPGDAASTRAAVGWAPAGARPFVARVVAPGEPDGVEWRACALPAPAAGELRIAVEAAGLGDDALDRALGIPGDRATPDDVLESHLVGRVEAVGEGVRGWQVGDRAAGRGRLARHACLDAALATRLAPGTDAAAAAASLPALADAAALLDDFAGLRAGHRTWIHGAETPLGAAAVAWAAGAGARVTASAADPDAARSLADGALPAGVRLYDPKADDPDRLVADATDGRGLDALVCIDAATDGAEDDTLVGRLDGALRPGGRRIDVIDPGTGRTSGASGAPATANRVRARVDVAAWRREAPERATACARAVAERMAAETGALPDPAVFPVGQLGRALHALCVPRGGRAQAVVLDFGPAEEAAIRPADGRRRLFEADGTYAVLSPSVPAARLLAEWMTVRGAGHVVIAGADGTDHADGRPDGDAPWRGIVAVEPSALAALLGPDAGVPAVSTPDLPTAALDAELFVRVAAGRTKPRTDTDPHGLWRTALARAGDRRRRAGRSVTTLHLAVPPAAPSAAPAHFLSALEQALLARDAGGLLVALPADGAPVTGLDPASPLFAVVRGRADAGAGAAARRDALAALPPAERTACVGAHVVDAVAGVLGMGEADRGRLGPAVSLDDLGLDSLMRLELAAALHRELGVEPKPALLGAGQSLGAIAEAIAGALATGGEAGA